jgi:hypothetical protein
VLNKIKKSLKSTKVKVLIGLALLILVINITFLIAAKKSAGNQKELAKATAITIIKDAEGTSQQEQKSINSLFSKIDYNDTELLSFFMCQAGERKPADVYVNLIQENANQNATFQSFVFGFVESLLSAAKGELETTATITIEEEEKYLILLTYKDFGLPIPLMMVNDKGKWKLDINSEIVVMLAGFYEVSPSQYAIDAINAILADPTRGNVERAADIARTAIRLDEKYNLWLSVSDILNDETVENIKKSSELSKQLTDLWVKTEELESQLPSLVVSDDKSSKISKEEYDCLKNGMTYEEVVSIIGGEGKIITDIGKLGEAAYTVLYVWESEENPSATVNILFEGGVMMNKAEYGI